LQKRWIIILWFSTATRYTWVSVYCAIKRLKSCKKNMSATFVTAITLHVSVPFNHHQVCMNRNNEYIAFYAELWAYTWRLPKETEACSVIDLLLLFDFDHFYYALVKRLPFFLSRNKTRVFTYTARCTTQNYK
jgi:hypothetical protein